MEPRTHTLLDAELAQHLYDAYNSQGPNPWKSWNGGDVPRWSALSGPAGEQVKAKWIAAAQSAKEFCAKAADLAKQITG